MSSGPSDSSGMLSLQTSEYNNTIGAFFISLVASVIFAASNAAQAVNYFSTYKQDHVVLKTLVAAACTTDGLLTIFICASVYYITVLWHGNLVKVQDIPWGTAITPTCIVLTNFLVRIPFCYRIWIFTGKSLEGSIIFGLITLISVTGVAFAIYFSVGMMGNAQWSILGSLEWDLYLCFSIQIVADTIITIYMTLLMKKQKGITSFTRTNDVLNNIILLTLRTGSLAVVIGVSSLIAHAASPNSLIAIAIYVLLAKVHINSMLSNLNARSKYREQVHPAKDLPTISIPESSDRSQDFELEHISSKRQRSVSLLGSSI